MDVKRADNLISETWKLNDSQTGLLFEMVAQELYGNEAFNQAVESGLKRINEATKEKINCKNQPHN
jgi:hypothetical protein